MRTLYILFKKELTHFLISPFGWIFFSVVIFMQGMSLSTALEYYQSGPVEKNLLFTILHTPNFWFYFLFIFPLITMRSFADEERTGTLEGLLTAPVKTTQVVISKYLAIFTYYSLLWLPLLLHLKLFAAITGQPAPVETGHILGSYFILYLAGAFFTAIGCLTSALTSSQIIAGIISMFTIVMIFFLGYVPALFGDSFQGAAIFHYISIQEHLAYFTQGLIDLRTVIYYISLTFFTLMLTHQVVDYRRWKK